MPIESADFQVQSGSSVIVTGSLEFDSDSMAIQNIQGSIFGKAIDGLSDFGGADNKIVRTVFSSSKSQILYTVGVDGRGLGFTAGGVSFRIFVNGPQPPASPPGTANAPQNVTFVDSNGDSISATFFAGGFDQILCFVFGTQIQTSRGKITVEALQVGDLAVTASGATRPIVWIGHRALECRRHRDLCPVRIAAHAFGSGLPARDLYLSPGHPVLVGAEHGEGGYLVPIMCLINGTTVRRQTVDCVTYWHIELDAHDILLAEGLPAESYIDLGSRPWFAGADGALYDPDMALPGMPGRCRPVAVDGPVVEAERQRLDMMFAVRLAAAAAWPVAEDALAL